MSFNTRFSREYAGGSIGGILRKGSSGANTDATSSAASAEATPRHVDLLVFGYACKLFRDDDKARDIDQGKHLIPWMNDASCKIDRYDVRGALYDLAPYEPPPGGYGNRLDYLSAEEQRAEQLCEEERYLYLYFNEEEHILQQEEDLKRLQQVSGGSAYSQMPFQYGNESGNGGAGIQHGPNRNESPTGDELETPFVLPAQFEVPPSIQLPETMKQHAIIEKTARFIASQGTQMEILLKAKQSNNAQFEFLIQNSKLNPYYKYVMQAIKEGKYPDIPESPSVDSVDGASNPLDAAAQTLSPVKTVITVPTIKYKPSADCAYTQLISKIKGVPLPSVLDTENAVSSPATHSPTPAGGDEPTDSFTPVLLKYNNSTYVQAADKEEEVTRESSKAGDENTNSNSCAEPQVEILKNSSALALAQGYSSDSDEEDEENAAAEAEKKVSEPIKPPVTLNFPIPTDNLQNIIDKTATYVIKNGRQFEETLRTKSEERFTFLLPNNEYYPYYMYKITGDPDAASKEEKTRKAAAVAAALLSKKGLLKDKTISPVSFSIKPKDDIAASNLAPALHQEPSDEEEESTAKKSSDAAAVGAAAQRNVPEHVQKAIKMVESQLMARNAQLAAVVLPPMMASINAAAAKKSSSSRFDIEHPVRNSTSAAATALSRSEKMEMERNALYEQQQQNRQKEIKKAEERVKDKLAQIAREKLGGLLSKEKQLQLERKRKAMVFLNQIKGETNAATSGGGGGENVIPKPAAGEAGAEATDGNASDGSNTSVHSIPITSYGPEERTDDEEEAPLKALPYILTTTATTTTDSLPKAASVAAKAQLSARTTTVTLSDDDDDEVQVINETKATTATARLPGREKIRRAPSSGHNKHYRRRGRSKENTEDSCCSSSTHTSSMSSSSSEDDEPSEKRRRRGKSTKRDDERRADAKLKKEKRHRSRKSKSKSKLKKKHHGSPARRAASYSSYAADSKDARGSKRRSRSRSPSRSSAVSSHRRERRPPRDRSRSRSRDSETSRSHSRRKHEKKSKSKSKSRHD